MTTQDKNGLLEAIEKKYKSLNRPDYSFVSQVSSATPYAATLKKIESLFDVKEITDTNDDVSFRYTLLRSGRQWVLELSMVGSFAVLFRTSDSGVVEVVTPGTSVPEEREICSLLKEGGFIILDQQELEQPCSLRLFNAEPENVRIYQALFSDTDVLPWKPL